MVSLVTGGAGFIGAHIVDELLKLNHTVIALDDLSGGLKKNVNKDAIFVNVSVTDEKVLDEIFSKYQIDYVYHLAAYAAVGLSHFIRKFNYNNNLIGSINLINRAVNHNIKRFIFTSSISVYGADQLPMSEDMNPIPEDPYGIAKYAVELDLKNAHELFDLKYTIFRPHNVYGSRQNHGDPYRNVLGIFINNMMLGEPLTIFGDGKQTRAFTHVSDVAPYIANCINIPNTENEIFNIGTDDPITILELAEMLCDILEVPRHITFLEARKELKHAHSTHNKIKQVFNIRETMPLKKGLEEMLEWSKIVGPIKPKKFQNIEITKNLPPSWQKLT